VSDGTGRFAFRELQPSRYEMVAELAGFATVSNVFNLTAGATVERRLLLQVGSVIETVSVGCSAVTALAAFRPASASDRSDVRRASLRLPSGNRQSFPAASLSQVPAGAPRPVRVGGQIQPPRPAARVNPVCPRTLLPASGTTVRLTGRIGLDGYMIDLRHVPGDATSPQPPQEFIDSALDAVSQWTFTPTLLNNTPIETTITVIVEYTRR
jgi:hypothetical protein